MSSIQRWDAEGGISPGDNREVRTYAAAMEWGRPFIRLKLDTDQPIELGEFVGAFTALASEYDRFIRGEHPGQTPDATLYVKEVRAGCIEADLIPWLVLGVPAVSAAAVGAMAAYNTFDEFVERLGARMATYKKPGGRLVDTTKGELNDYLSQVAAIASTPGSALEVSAIEIVDGEKIVRAAFKFNTEEAREIEQRVAEHKKEMDHTNRADHTRVLMTFVRSDKRDAAVGKRSGELVEINRISDKPRPLIYAADLAEQKIKHEITTGDSIYKKGFMVDVNVEMRGARPVAYAVTHVHDVIDLPDDED